jgi:hypothetical protein
MCITQTNRQLVLSKEIIILYCQTYAKGISSLLGQNTELRKLEHMVGLYTITTGFKRLVILKILTTGAESLIFTVREHGRLHLLRGRASFFSINGTCCHLNGVKYSGKQTDHNYKNAKILY